MNLDVVVLIAVVLFAMLGGAWLLLAAMRFVVTLLLALLGRQPSFEVSPHDLQVAIMDEPVDALVIRHLRGQPPVA